MYSNMLSTFFLYSSEECLSHKLINIGERCYGLRVFSRLYSNQRLRETVWQLWLALRSRIYCVCWRSMFRISRRRTKTLSNSSSLVSFFLILLTKSYVKTALFLLFAVSSNTSVLENTGDVGKVI